MNSFLIESSSSTPSKGALQSTPSLTCNMANNGALFVVELLALISCIGGIAAIVPVTSSYLSLFYLGGWFFLGACCNIAGLLSLSKNTDWKFVFFYLEDQGSLDNAHAWLHRHFLLCWFTLVLGYPTLVTSFWMVYYPTPTAHAFCILGLIPFSVWLFQQPSWIPITTKIGMSGLILLHATVCIEATNWFGFGGTCLMVANVISMTIPTSHTALKISSREAFVTGIAVASLLYAQAVRVMYNNPTPLDTIVPRFLYKLI